MKKFEAPELEILTFAAEDVLTESVGDFVPCENETGIF